jgi:signal transduction histidine kinase
MTGQEASAKGNKRVLVVEDDRDILKALESILGDNGYEVSTATDGREALNRLARDVPPDVILLDLRLPVMDGWTFRNVQRRDSQLAPIPVVAMSADGTSQAQAISADAFLRKPLDIDDVLSTLQRVIDERETKRRSDHQNMVERMASLGRVAAGVGHEINNPLAFVLMNVTLASERVQKMASAGHPEAKALADMLDDSLVGLERIRVVVRNLQRLSRAASDKREAVNLEKVIDESIVVASNNIQHRARLSKTYGGVPRVHGSADALGQVFLNLLVNAAQAITDGDAFGNVITVGTAFDGEHVVVEIADTGQGIPPDVLPHVFDPFFTTKPVDEGTGLGLAICQRIVTDHGGRLTIESEVGRGTLCRLSFPPARGDQAAPGRPEDPSPPPAVAVPRRRGRLLVIDDEAKIGEVIVQALSPRYDVVAVQDAQSAFDLLDAGQVFDVVLCDVMMPNIAAREVLQAFGRWPALLPGLIFMTGGAFSDEATVFLRRARRPILFKPFTPPELMAMVEARLNAQPTGAS